MGGKQGSEGCTTWGGWEWNNTPLSAVIFEMMEQTVSVCCAWWAGLAIGTWVSVCVSVFGWGEGGGNQGQKKKPTGEDGNGYVFLSPGDAAECELLCLVCCDQR